MRIFLLFLTSIVVAAMVLGCQARQAASPVEETLSMAVAAFHQAGSVEELLAGHIPPGSETASAESLRSLDAYLGSQLSSRGRAHMDVSLTTPCEEQTAQAMSEEPGSALEYWVKVGQCVSADYVLVPQVVYWKERQGSAVGSVEPAGVAIDFYVVDVKGFGLVTRYHYEETQVALSDNLLTIDAFVSRGGQWVMAEKLAKEAITKALDQFGL